MDSSLSVALVLCSFLLLPLLFTPDHCVEAFRMGGYVPIKNVTSPRVVELAKYAVMAHNERANASLVFGRVVNGESEWAGGMYFRLLIAAWKGNVSGTYQARVVKPLRGLRYLTSFQDAADIPKPGAGFPNPAYYTPILVKVPKHSVKTQKKPPCPPQVCLDE